MSYIGAKPAEQILSSADIQDGSIATADLADASITQAKLASGVAGTGPAFRTTLSGTQSGITSGVWTKVTFDTETWDTNNCFTTSKFTPTVAGYYSVFIGVDAGLTTSPSRVIPGIYKNGSLYSNGMNVNATPTYSASYGDMVYLNGTTDYIEAYVYILGTSPAVASSSASFFCATLGRSA